MKPRSSRFWGGVIAVIAIGGLLLAAGCQLFVNEADREVYRLIDKRQEQAVGVRHDAHIGTEHVPIKPGDTDYEFVPHPVSPDLPASFQNTAPAVPPTTQPTANAMETAANGENGHNGGPTSTPSMSDADRPEPLPLPPTRNPMLTSAPAAGPAASAPEFRNIASAPAENGKGANGTSVARGPTSRPAFNASGPIFPLTQVLAHAFGHAREFQTAKEDLYLAALALTLERHLWTPRFVGNIKSQYANYGEVLDWDQAMDMVATVGVEQKLPYGGTLTAQVINSLMRDLTNNVTTGETGQVLLRADIPLLKGAGPVAYESRYQAERQLIYAVRAFERFRRALAVDIAADYFNLQQLRQAIVNSSESIEGFHQLARRARAMWKAGKVTILDVQRAEQDELNASNDLLNSIELYQTALDVFKIRIGMPTEQQIAIEPPVGIATSQPAAVAGNPADAASQALIGALAMPIVDEKEALRVALRYRLDLLNQLDQIGDAERGVVIAENSLLPQLDMWASVQYYTDPGQLGAFKYNSDQATYRAGVNLELPLDRKAEQTRLRESLILKRRAERAYQQARDTVVGQVRRAMRRVELQRILLQTQTANRQLAQRRLQAAKYKFQHALVAALEVVDAQNALLRAQNGLAQAQAAYKVAILQFWRDTDTLRIAEDGKWDFALATGTDSR